MDTESSPVGGAKVLVVDDNAQNRELARAALDDEGYAVVLASDGEAALASVERDRPDCVLLDVRMPGMDGHAVCERIRALPGGAELPVIFLTALRDVDTFDRALRVGGTDFLTKPVQPVELVLRVQQALKMRRLDAAVRSQYDELRRQRDALYRAQLLQEDLAAFVVHDLKNPVNAIDLQALLIERDRDATARTRDAAGRIRDNARDLQRLIHNLLDITRAEQGRLVLMRRPVALGATLDEVVAARRPQAEDAGVTLRAEVTAVDLDADVDLLRRVIENLVENAIRHAPAGSTVRVGAAPVDGGVELTVSDEGVGVPEAMREAIFERFVQIDGAARERVGRGLGLSFCRLAVEAHGGRIWVEDAQPGAVFRVRLPAVAPEGGERTG